MEYIKFFKDITKEDVSLAGGKGASLGEMTRAGIQVPPGFVVTAEAFAKFASLPHIKDEIKKALEDVKVDDINSIDRASNVLRDVIHDTPIQSEIVSEVLEAFERLGAELVAVRSSATAEDSQVASWAGELETYLNTTRDELIANVKKCWSSLFTPRAIFYRHEKNLVDHNVQVAVVVQKMIQSEISGICFTVHPVTEDPNQMIIEAGFGLGEAIVSGQITPDSYIVNKATMEVGNINIGEQSKKLVKKNKKNVWVKLTKQESASQKLTSKQIIQVAKVCQKIEQHYGFACDIEWAIEGGQVYVTQSRPITTLKK